MSVEGDEDATHARAAEPDGKDSEPSALEQRLIGYARLGVPALTVAGALVAGSVQGPPAAILVLAGGALAGVIAMFWGSVRTLVGETPLTGADAFALGTPRAEEEQKRAVLRALKDLEFERSIGKISEEDYQELVTRYRAEAKRLLRLLDADAQPGREQVEALVQKRLRREGLIVDRGPAPVTAKAPPGKDAGGKDARRKKRGRAGDAGTKPAEKPPEAPAALPACASCGTVNELDAVFCKRCGTRREPAEAASPAVVSHPPDEAAETDS